MGLKHWHRYSKLLGFFFFEDGVSAAPFSMRVSMVLDFHCSKKGPRLSRNSPCSNKCRNHGACYNKHDGPSSHVICP